MSPEGDGGPRRDRSWLIVPAAGIGSRLGSQEPKVLTPVAGRPMFDYLLDLYAPRIERFVFVVRPGVEPTVEARGRARGLSVECDVQATPSGMLDAILVPLSRVQAGRPDWVWITWCDQVAILPETALALAGALEASPRPRLVLPTCRQADPYIHFEREAGGRIAAVRQRREGDEMPAQGESDAGLFVLDFDTYTRQLPLFASEAMRGRATGERNFLPFVAWLSRRFPGAVATLPCREPIESVGINTPDELRRVAAHLAARPGAGGRSASS